MNLYLIQHGEAVPKEVDAERPLSDTGRRDVQQIASFLGNAGIRVTTVLHSGKRRAEQTADLLAASFGENARIEKVSGIDPLDPTEPFAKAVSGRAEDTMIVGHLPFMGRLVSRLIVGDEAASVVDFRPGTVVRLVRTDAAKWSLAWMIRPELLAASGQEQP